MFLALSYTSSQARGDNPRLFLFSLQREEKQTITPVLTNKLFKFVNTCICMEINYIQPLKLKICLDFNESFYM